ncbi:MAG: T9SS type A sorting domain-containing protein [Chitinophagales bacterium]|nr:T9SS type A sorting domain-containing protein [Chitinophagales bacterium]
MWFPCFDNFKQRSLYEFQITTKNTHKALCNGILQSEVDFGQNKIWTWQLNQPIPSYLASVAVSQYEILRDTVHGLNGVKEVLLAARANDTTKVKNLFVHLPDAFHIYENLFGAYLWDRVGYCIVPFNAGAMEHATNIAFMQNYLNAYSAECEETMAHELSHHWFGDLVTCDSASEMWLNEGWARYCEKLFLEQFYGDSVYRQSVRTLHEDVLHRTHIRDGEYLPVSGVPSAQTYSSTVYDKGSDMIHTLRYYMGDAAFFSCVKNYLDSFKFKSVSTAQMRDYFSQCSGIDLTAYFNNWIYTKGFTHFSIENLQYETETVGTETRNRAKFTIRQKLNNAPEYFTNVPVVISYFTNENSSQRFTDTVWVNGSCADHISAYSNLSENIKMVALDFDENLQDAISDFWYEVKDTGLYDFDVARAKLNVQELSEPDLLRIEHNWIHPEPMKDKISGLHLSNRRYWTIDGTWQDSSAIRATATFAYDGTDAGLDADLFSTTEDNLSVLYRPNSETEWQIADSFFVNTQNSISDKKGEIIVNNIQKGQYCFGIWNALLADTSVADADCIFTSINSESLLPDFKLYPNPASQFLQVEIQPNTFNKAKIIDLTGRVVAERIINRSESIIYLQIENIARGMYFVELSNAFGNRRTKTLVVK